VHWMKSSSPSVPEPLNAIAWPLLLCPRTIADRRVEGSRTPENLTEATCVLLVEEVPAG